MTAWLLSPLGKAVGVLAIAAALYLAWQADRAYQRAAGAKATRLEYEALLRQSKALTDEETKAAVRAASDAARSVCISAGVDPAECSDL